MKWFAPDGGLQGGRVKLGRPIMDQHGTCRSPLRPERTSNGSPSMNSWSYVLVSRASDSCSRSCPANMSGELQQHSQP
ncbi:MAG: hypothetical protein E6J34_19330 [Chloroflexi bacterium]|nr:MAG: hypothetical protein E6J34_19330 [Chloroflexota bacterium]